MKIDLEIAEIIEVKVATFSIKIISMLKVATLTLILLAISKSIFKILVPIM